MKGLRQLVKMAESIATSQVSLTYKPHENRFSTWEAEIRVEVYDVERHHDVPKYATGYGDTPVLALAAVERDLRRQLVASVADRQDVELDT